MASRRVYDEAVKTALTIIWEAADRICGKRLKAAIPNLIRAMEKHGHLQLNPEVRKLVLKVSAATIDRLLTPVRKGAGARRRRHAKKRVSRAIPIKTFSDWKDPAPGFLEIDFVVHGGGSMAGEYLHSLVVTDVCSGWVEAVPLLAREQNLVIAGLDRIREQFPVVALGIDSDNDGAFINDTLAAYCQEQAITFTRSRPHHSNDQAWIEQKNGAVIRRMVGHERFSGIVAGQALAQLLQVVRLYVNYFQPSFKLRERVREGSKVKKSYHPPATPVRTAAGAYGSGGKDQRATAHPPRTIGPGGIIAADKAGTNRAGVAEHGQAGRRPRPRKLESVSGGTAGVVAPG
jgi:hypothetical protein